jgi:hypothetical protein
MGKIFQYLLPIERIKIKPVPKQFRTTTKLIEPNFTELYISLLVSLLEGIKYLEQRFM